MNTFTRLALVLLRIAIGWHFLFEGVAKVETHLHGGSETKPLWTSEPFLRDATGPLASYFRQPLDDPDPDASALTRLTLPKTNPGETAKLPTALEQDWQQEFDRFVTHYKVGTDLALPPEYVALLGVTPQAGLPGTVPWAVLPQLPCANSSDKLQLALVKCDFQHAKEVALAWFQVGTKNVEIKVSKVEEKIPQTNAKRIEAYRKLVKQLNEIETVQNPAFGQDVWKKKLPELRKEVAKTRKELLEEANAPFKNTLDFLKKQRLTSAQRELGELPKAEPAHLVPLIGVRWITLIDRVTMWGLIGVGACILLGLFTRFACVLGALFLLSLYLAMPPWPGLPQDPNLRSHFLYVNLNLIESLALLCLATTATGKWVGLDGLVPFLNPFRSKKPSAPKATISPSKNPSGSTGAHLEQRFDRSVSPPIQPKEPAHGP